MVFLSFSRTDPLPTEAHLELTTSTPVLRPPCPPSNPTPDVHKQFSLPRRRKFSNDYRGKGKTDLWGQITVEVHKHRQWVPGRDNTEIGSEGWGTVELGKDAGVDLLKPSSLFRPVPSPLPPGLLRSALVPALRTVVRVPDTPKPRVPEVPPPTRSSGVDTVK